MVWAEAGGLICMRLGSIMALPAGECRHPPRRRNHTQRTKPSAMNEDTERRLTNLEIKATYAEDTLERLNEVIVRQQAQIDQLVREVVLLRAQTPADEAPAFRSLRDELPPHY